MEPPAVDKDIVERLRHMTKLLGFDMPDLLNSAADEIVQLRCRVAIAKETEEHLRRELSAALHATG